jgi:hypothetical protein
MNNDPILIERERIQDEINELKAKTSDDLFEEILNLIECHDQSAYRKKIKGFRLAFNIRDKTYRIPVDTVYKDVKNRSKKSADEIKQKVKEMRDNRVNMQKNKELKEKHKLDRNRKMLQRMHEKLRNEKHGNTAYNANSTYYKHMLKSKLTGARNIEPKHTPVSLDVLKRMHYTDFNMGDDDDFRPADIIDEDDDSDDSIFEQYKSNQESEITLPRENVILNSQGNQYNEKVVGIKHHINKDEVPRKMRGQYLKNKSQNRIGMKEKDSAMLGRYKSGRNVSQAKTKNDVGQSYIAYPQPGSDLKPNNSVSKINKSMNSHPLSENPNRSINVNEDMPGYSRGSTKAVDSKRIKLKDKKGKQGAALLPLYHRKSDDAVDLKYRVEEHKNKLAKLKRNRNPGKYNSNDVNNTITEQGILKLVDKRINNGMKAVNKSSAYNY